MSRSNWEQLQEEADDLENEILRIRAEMQDHPENSDRYKALYRSIQVMRINLKDMREDLSDYDY